MFRWSWGGYMYFLQATPPTTGPIQVELVSNSFPWQTLFGFIGVLVGGAITIGFTLWLESSRQTREDKKRGADCKALLELFSIELVYVLDRCVQYICQAVRLDKAITDSRADHLGKLVPLGQGHQTF